MATNGRVWGFGAAAVCAAVLSMPTPAGAATIPVSDTADDLLSAADDGDCALREAVEAASRNEPVDLCAAGEADPAEDTILLTDGATYVLTGSPDDEDNLTGDLDISIAGGAGPLTIEGETDRATIDGGGIDRVLDFAGSAALVRVTITNGSSPTFGGGIRTRGDAALTLTDSSVVGNSASDGPGGGLYLSGNATLTNSRVLQNIATGEGGGVYNSGARLSLNRSLAESNHAPMGAGIANEGSGTLDLRAAIVRDNQAATAGAQEAAGGGILNTGTATVDGSVISSNVLQGSIGTPIRGAGIANRPGASLTVTDSTIAANAMFGGVETGAGISNEGGSSGVSIRNSTISGNRALGPAADGGGLHSSGGEVSLNHVTLADNGASDQGDAIGNVGTTALSLRASVIDNGADACQGQIASGGFNVDAGASCASATTASDVPNTATGINPELANNGGPQAGPSDSSEIPRTHALQEGSPAIDRVPAAQCFDVGTTLLTTDQRGFPRPEFSAGCDSGAYEVFVPFVLANGDPPSVPADSSPPVVPAKKKCKRKKRRGGSSRRKCRRRG